MTIDLKFIRDKFESVVVVSYDLTKGQERVKSYPAFFVSALSKNPRSASDSPSLLVNPRHAV